MRSEILIKFTPKEFIKAFDLYFENRPEMLKWGATEKYDIVVKTPPSLIGFSKWLQFQEIKPTWKRLTYSKLRKTLEMPEYEDVKNYINAVIEEEVVNNSLIKNYDGTFAKNYLANKSGWSDKAKVEFTTPIIEGVGDLDVDFLKDLFNDEQE